MRMARGAVEYVRLALARETLGDPPAAQAPPEGAKRPGVLHLLFVSREPLGEEPAQVSPRRRSILPRLFRAEALPLDPEERPRRSGAPQSFLGALFAIEELPRDPVPPLAKPRRGRLAALFGAERLDELP
jgi:hypothetical protein